MFVPVADLVMVVHREGRASKILLLILGGGGKRGISQSVNAGYLAGVWLRGIGFACLRGDQKPPLRDNQRPQDHDSSRGM
jgi:hypothetical protein